MVLTAISAHGRGRGSATSDVRAYRDEARLDRRGEVSSRPRGDANQTLTWPQSAGEMLTAFERTHQTRIVIRGTLRPTLIVMSYIL